MSLRSRCSCEVEKCSMILVKISKSLRHLFNICLSAETIENTNEIYPVTFDGLGRRGGVGGGGVGRGRVTRSKAISGF